MIRALTQFIQRKRAQRRSRAKGVARLEMYARGRNRPRGTTSEELWAKVYRFREKPPARAGTKRRKAREKAAKKGPRRFLMF